KESAALPWGSRKPEAQSKSFSVRQSSIQAKHCRFRVLIVGNESWLVFGRMDFTQAPAVTRKSRCGAGPVAEPLLIRTSAPEHGDTNSSKRPLHSRQPRISHRKKKPRPCNPPA